MSEHKTSFESDVESLDISEDFVLVGLNNGSSVSDRLYLVKGKYLL